VVAAQRGLIIDPGLRALSVGSSCCARSPASRGAGWAILALDAVALRVMWFCYEMTRGAADKGIPIPFTDGA
jgi:hypothetical protein